MIPCSHRLTTDSLFGIVGGIRKNSREKSPFNAIDACHDNTVFVSVNKLVIENLCPLSMEQFSMTMRKKRVAGEFVSGVIECEILEVVWQLSRLSEFEAMHSHKGIHTYTLKIRDMVT